MTMREERGSITLWMVGLMMVILAVGGVALDLWRGLAAHRQVAAAVDAAAVAAGSALAENAWREHGDLVLDPARVERHVGLAMEAQSGGPPIVYHVTTAFDGSRASITASTRVELTLLGLLTDGALEVSARATAMPALSP